MKAIAFDIETIPNEDMIQFLETPEPSKAIKDPVKIQADIEAKKAEQKDKMALSPLTGRIACYSAFGEDHKGEEYDEEEYLQDMNDINKSEAFVVDCALTLIRNTVAGGGILVTWNGSGFDLPFVYGRAMALGVEIPTGLPTLSELTKRYIYQPHCDLMKAVNLGEYVKLNTVSRVFLNGEQKIDFDVKQILQFFKDGKQEEVVKYCTQDTALTFKLYKKVQPYIFTAKEKVSSK
jgi:predicted PolB exonuclease-like 3'-5' exonuclease